MSTDPRYVRPTCEPLEARDVPAGNVAASLVNGVLYLSGDAFDNQFSVQQSPAGDVNVIGLNGTTINGVPSLYIGRGNLAGLAVDSWLGNDYVEILGVVTSGGIWAVTGNENDGIFVGGVLAGSLYLDAQGGNDGVVTSSVYVNTFAEVSGGSGFDGYDWDNLYAAWLYVHDFEVIT